RRRHTRSDRDWSADVCSSDLEPPVAALEQLDVERGDRRLGAVRVFGAQRDPLPGRALFETQRDVVEQLAGVDDFAAKLEARLVRSEERRVGKQRRSWTPPYHQ